MLKYFPSEGLIKGELNWSLANYGTVINKALLVFFGIDAGVKYKKINIYYNDHIIECRISHLKGNSYHLRWDNSTITSDLKIKFGDSKDTFSNNITARDIIVLKKVDDEIIAEVQHSEDILNIVESLPDGEIADNAMNELLLELSTIFIGYLRLFLERAKLVNPELSQIPIPTELAQIAQKIGISFKTSFGMGTPTKIPWLACFFPNQSASVDGVYPVILFRKDPLIVTVNYGVSATAHQTDGNWPKKWPDELVTGLSHFPDKKYKESYVLESYDCANTDNLEDIADSFIKIIADFIVLKKNNSGELSTDDNLLKSMSGILLKINNDFNNSNFLIQESMAVRYIASLLAKRFVILTGLSGSGKTKLAHAFASWLSKTPDQYRLVSVGADWTSNENVLGYQDAIQPSIYRKPATGALDLILRARKDKERPYFLILDEMNLSHVERYFADVLSAIESGDEIQLHSALDDLNQGELITVPSKFTLPDNLFIVGTVNVDETTYMFSPKVLDRANVIEFRATKEDIDAFLTSPARVKMDYLAGKGEEFGPAFVQLAATEVSPTGISSEIADGAKVAEDLKARLLDIFDKLVPIGGEFGFRTVIEISRFVYYHATLSGPEWDFNDALDAQVIQKLMPKLHGSDRKLRPTLEALKTFCTLYNLPLSLVKTNRMLDRLKDGFTSFSEA